MLEKAHDLGSLLTVSNGNRQRAEQDLARVLEHLHKARQADERAMQIVRGILHGPRTTDNALPGVFDINAVAREIVSLLDSGQILGDVRMTLEHWPSALDVRGDGLALFRALLNLCMNARNAMADKIALKTGVAGISGCISLEDNGTGIDRIELSQLWERPPIIDGPHGHGLAIVRSTLKELGGAIEFDSKPGIGTKFSICLPLVTGMVAA